MDERKLKGLALRSLISDCQELVKLRGEGRKERKGKERKEGKKEGRKERKREGGRDERDNVVS